MAADDTENNQEHTNTKRITPKKIYLKDASYEAPNSPGIFEEKWKPTLELEIDNDATEIAENTFEVVLTVSVRAIIEGKTAYMAEVHQAGIFTFSGFELEEIRLKKEVFCLMLIFPYASAELSDLVSKGGFPQLLLSPINFRALYDKRQENKQAQADAAESAQDA